MFSSSVFIISYFYIQISDSFWICYISHIYSTLRDISPNFHRLKIPSLLYNAFVHTLGSISGILSNWLVFLLFINARVFSYTKRLSPQLMLSHTKILLGYSGFYFLQMNFISSSRFSLMDTFIGIIEN